MQKPWKLLFAFALGLLAGLCWRPYSVEVQRLGNASAIVQMNRINGRSWRLLPGDIEWQPIRNPRVYDPDHPHAKTNNLSGSDIMNCAACHFVEVSREVKK